jgi:hypothetical protein
MEFSTPNKAKKITLSLIILGSALAVIGIATGMDDHHFATRLLTNGLMSNWVPPACPARSGFPANTAPDIKMLAAIALNLIRFFDIITILFYIN